MLVDHPGLTCNTSKFTCTYRRGTSHVSRIHKHELACCLEQGVGRPGGTPKAVDWLPGPHQKGLQQLLIMQWALQLMP